MTEMKIGISGIAADADGDARHASPWRAWARFLERSSRRVREGDDAGIVEALLEAVQGLTHADAVFGAWTVGPCGSPMTRSEAVGLATTDAALLAAEFEGRCGCVDEVRFHALDADPGLDGMLVQERLRALGFGRSALVTVACREGNLALAVRCLFRGDTAEVDVARDNLLALAQHAAGMLSGLSLERRLKEATGRLAAISNGVVDAIVITDDAGAITSVNKAFLSMFGYAPHEILGRDLTVLVQERDRVLHEQAMRWRAANRGTPSHAIGKPRELEAVRRDGTVFPIELALGDNGSGGGFVGVIRDATERKAVEQRVREADRMAAIGRLAAGLGHDMNNMLFPIRAHLNALMAAHAGDPSPRLREHADQIERGVGHLQNLADTLHFLAIDPELGGDDGSATDIASWWRISGALLSRALHRRAHLRPEIAGDLPPVAIPQHALTRAVLNLLTNAANAMPAARGADESLVIVRARRGASGSFVVLEVADNGVGMSDEVRRRAGEMFFTTRPRGVGTGLGLAMVGRVVTDAGGRVEIDSAPGHGTTVRLMLPAVAEAPEAGTVQIELHDGRVRAVVVAVVENCGMIVADEEEDAASALAWVVDGASVDSARVGQWMRSHPGASVVVLGEAPAEILASCGPLGIAHVADVRDYRAIERALMAVFEPMGQETSHD